jgi:hypothetical protein
MQTIFFRRGLVFQGQAKDLLPFLEQLLREADTLSQVVKRHLH